MNSVTPAHHSGHSNPSNGYSSQPPMRDSLVANNAQTRNYNTERPQTSQKTQKETKGPCRDFTAGRCKRDPCRFSHSGQAPEHKNDDQKQKSAPTRNKNAPSVVLNNTHPKSVNLQVFVDGAKSLDTRIWCVVRKSPIGQKRS